MAFHQLQFPVLRFQFLQQHVKNSYIYYIITPLQQGLFTGGHELRISSQPAAYQLYLEGRWSELAENGKEAIAEGYDYYYMRMRMGIAYYERQNYGLAAYHFNKAMEFNENDQFALEYLFYSYYLSGRYFQAWAALSDLFPTNRRERVKNESRIKKNSVTAEVFYSNANTENITGNPDAYFTNPEAGSQIVTKYFINNQIYFSHITGRRSSYF